MFGSFFRMMEPHRRLLFMNEKCSLMEASGLSCGGHLRENFEHLRKAIKTFHPETLRSLVRLYMTDFG